MDYRGSKGMCMKKLEELSVVRLKDGRSGTIVHVYEKAQGVYLLEVDDDTHDLVDIHADEIDEVEWEP